MSAVFVKPAGSTGFHEREHAMASARGLCVRVVEMQMRLSNYHRGALYVTVL